MTLRTAACWLMTLTLLLPAAPLTGADPAPSGSNLLNLEAASEPPATPPATGEEPGSALPLEEWVAIPVLRSRLGAPTDTALYLVELQSLGLSTEDVRTAGIPLLPMPTERFVDHDEIRPVALPIEQVAKILGELPAFNQPTSHVSMATGVPITLFVDRASHNAADEAVASLAWEHAREIHASEVGITFNQIVYQTDVAVNGVNGLITDVQTYCDMQTFAAYEETAPENFRGHLVVIFSVGKVSDGPGTSDNYGIQIDGPISNRMKWGESGDECRGGTRTPAFLPTAYVSLEKSGPWTTVGSDVINFADRQAASYWAAHEIGHAFDMQHKHVECDPPVSELNPLPFQHHQHKTLEGTSSGGYQPEDPNGFPQHCANHDDWWNSHYHYTFSTAGRAAMNAMHQRWVDCMNAIGSWCPNAATPSKVRNLVATAGTTEVTLSWTAPESNGGTPINDYVILQGNANNFQSATGTSTGSTATTYMVGNLVPGQTYWFYVRASNGFSGAGTGWGPRSEYVSAIPASPTGPSGYTYCAVENAFCSFSGTRNVAYGTGTTYNYRNSVSNGITCSNLEFGDPAPGSTKYCFYSGLAPPAPGSPSPWSGQTGVSTIPTLSWSAVSDPEGTAVRYNVFIGSSHPPAAWNGCQDISATSCTVGIIAHGTQYHWGVTACDASNMCSTLGDWHFTTQSFNQAPPAPGSPTPWDGQTGISTSPTFWWSAVSDPEGSQVTYDLYLDSEHPVVPRSGCQDLTTTSCTLTGLLQNTYYHWGVVACDPSGACSTLTDWHFTTQAPQTPEAPNQPYTTNGDYSYGTGETITFCSTGSWDPQGDNIQYVFNWGDGSSVTASNTVPHNTEGCAQHAWNAPGSNLCVKAYAQDLNSPASDYSACRYITVTAPQTPEVPDQPYTTNGDYSYVTGETITFCSNGSWDPQGNNIQYVFNWGDGSSVTASNTVPHNTEGCAQHSWGTTGTNLCVKAYAQDLNSPASDYSACRYITVTSGSQTPEAPDQPYTTSGHYNFVTGETITFCSTGSWDPQGDNIQYVFNWGDGSSVTASNTVPHNTEGCAQHSWSTTGTDICVKAYAQDLNSPASAYSSCRYISVTTGPPSCSGGPGNNCFTAGYAGSGTSWFPASQSTSGATTEPNEPLPCGSMGATVWYYWTPSQSGTYRFSTDSSNSDYDTVLAVYSGSSLTSLSQLGCNDDFAAPDRQSQLDLSLTAGVTYRVQVGGYSGATGTLLLDIWKL